MIHIDYTELSGSDYDPSQQPLPQPRIVVGLVSGKYHIKEARSLPDTRASRCLLLASVNIALHWILCLEVMPYDEVFSWLAR